MESGCSSSNGEEVELKVEDEIEQYKLGVLRSSVEKHDPTSKEFDDMTLRRFLRARDSNVEKASSFFLKYLKWRREFVPNGFITESEISKHLADKKIYLQGANKAGHPIAVVLAVKHFPNNAKGGLDGFKRFCVYFLDKLCARIPRGEEKFGVIADLQGWGYANSDIRGYLGALSILQDCYPERLGKLYLVNVPSIFMTAWKVIYPFIDKNTRKKIVFVDKKKLTPTLLQDISENQLPQIYGGKLPLVSIEDS